MYWYSFAGGTLGLDARLVHFARLSVVLLFIFFHFKEMQIMITLSRALKKTRIHMELEDRTNGSANPVIEEYYRRTINFLLLNRLKTNVPVR